MEDEKAGMETRLMQLEQQLTLGQQGWDQRQTALQADRYAC